MTVDSAKQDDTPKSGMWAHSGGKFYALVLEQGDRKTDHVTWFASLGLPDYGPEYDRMLRGRMTWDWHFDHYVLTYYGVHEIPNLVYQKIVKHFNPNGEKVVEKPIGNCWV